MEKPTDIDQYFRALIEASGAARKAFNEFDNYYTQTIKSLEKKIVELQEELSDLNELEDQEGTIGDLQDVIASLETEKAELESKLDLQGRAEFFNGVGTLNYATDNLLAAELMEEFIDVVHKVPTRQLIEELQNIKMLY